MEGGTIEGEFNVTCFDLYRRRWGLLMRPPCFALLLLLTFLVTGSCSRQEPAPAVTVVFFGQGTPVSYECDEVALMGQLSDGRALYRCSIWGKASPGR